MRNGRSGIGHTCPDIDNIIANIKSAIKSAEWGIKNPESEYQEDNYNDIINELDGIERQMEELRSSNSRLRDFGEEQTKIVEELEEEIDLMQLKIENLNDTIDDLKREISNLESDNAWTKTQ